MHNYRVIRVLIDDINKKYTHKSKEIVKFVSQYKTTQNIKKKRTFLPDKFTKVKIWKDFQMIVEGTDEFQPCLYDTKDEAWERIHKHINIKFNNKTYNITEVYYDK